RSDRRRWLSVARRARLRSGERPVAARRRQHRRAGQRPDPARVRRRPADPNRHVACTTAPLSLRSSVMASRPALAAVMVLAGHAAANPIPPVVLHAKARGSALEITLRNWGDGVVTIPVSSPGFDDHLAVRLTADDGSIRDFSFVEPLDRPNDRKR